MKVLHLGKYYPPHAGGMETYLFDLMAAAAARGVRSVALVHAKGGAGQIADSVWRVPRLGELLYTPVSPSYPLWLERAIRVQRPHLLHIHLPNPSALWVLLSPRARKLPWVIHWHADVVAEGDPTLALALRAQAPLERRLLRRSRAIIATSRRYLDASLPLQPWRDKTEIVPLGRNPGALLTMSDDDRAFAESAWPADGPRLLALGRMSVYKGFDLLLRALVRVPGVQLAIAGPETDSALKPLAAQLELTGRVGFLGYQPQGRINALLAGCDCLCLPSTSRAEAFGMVLIEAMSLGKPLIVSDIPGSGVGKLVMGGGCGQLFPVGEVEILAHHIRDLVEHPDTWRRMGCAGGLAFAERFDIRRSVEKILAIYRRSVPIGGYVARH